MYALSHVDRGVSLGNRVGFGRRGVKYILLTEVKMLIIFYLHEKSSRCRVV